MTLSEATQILEAVGRKAPNLIEAVAVFVENHKVGGDYAYAGLGQGEVWEPDSGHDVKEKLAAAFREMRREPAADRG